MPCDSVAAAVWSKASPQLDELLAAYNVDQKTAAQWATPGFFDVDLNREAVARGWATTAADSSPQWAGLGHVMVHAWPQSLGENRWWWLMVSRQDKPFTEDEKVATQLLLQSWATRFNRPSEAHLGRVLLGHDNRILCSDLQTRETLLSDPAALNDMLAELKTIVEQRFPDMSPGDSRDFVANIASRPNWIVVLRCSAVNEADASNWYLELRPLQADELPVIGAIDDDRIARAIAYLHSNYHESPSLAQIARAVHTSPFHFHRLFTKEVGVSPKQYLQRRQLQVAKWMLRATREPIGTIAGETGFASHGHFTSTFHRVVGLSPSDYRDKSVINGSKN